MAWGVRPHPRINSVEALWFLGPHPPHRQRRESQEFSDGTAGCTAQADPNSGQTKRESLVAD